MNIIPKISFTLQNILRRQYTADVGKFVNFQCKVSSESCIPKTIRLTFHRRNVLSNVHPYRPIGCLLSIAVACATVPLNMCCWPGQRTNPGYDRGPVRESMNGQKGRGREGLPFWRSYDMKDVIAYGWLVLSLLLIKNYYTSFKIEMPWLLIQVIILMLQMVILDFMSNSLKPAQHFFLLFFKNADLSVSYNIQYM